MIPLAQSTANSKPVNFAHPCLFIEYLSTYVPGWNVNEDDPSISATSEEDERTGGLNVDSHFSVTDAGSERTVREK